MRTLDIMEVFENSCRAFNAWRNIGVAERVGFLKNLRRLIVDELDALTDVICSDTGKVHADALMSDIYPCLEILSYYIKNLPRILKPERKKLPLLFTSSYAEIQYRPSGTALVIAPWNFPFQLAFIPVVTAVAAGNSVVLKPSDVTPRTGQYIESLFERAGFPPSLVQCVFGGAEAVQACLSCQPARVLFTGSTFVGREIAAECGRRLIPVVLELGGKGPAVVLADCDLARTANGLLYGAFVNNGQVCVAVTRILAAQEVYEELLGLLVQKARTLELGRDYGSLILPQRAAHLNQLIEQAVSAGAHVYDTVPRHFNSPIIIGGVTKDMAIFKEECFAPVLCVSSFESEDDAVSHANNSPYGLSASVWSKDINKARHVAAQIDAGHISINDVVKGVGAPDLPFGGVKASGMGRYHGADGIQFFADKITLLVNSSQNRSEINWFPYTPVLYDDLKKIVCAQYNLFSAGLGVVKSLLRLLGRTKR